MGVDCYGWVEVNDPELHRPTEPDFPNWWSAVVCIDDIVDRSYDVYGFFFSVYRHPENPVASHRGLPTQVSEQVQETADDPSWGMTAVTWVLWSEILASNWQASISLPAGWTLLFALMERLAADYGNDRVRLVIWFDSDRRV
jgi:hypothetical protein